MGSLQGFYTWLQSQALILLSIFVIIAAAGVIWKKAWFSGLWIFLGTAIFAFFLKFPDKISSISAAVGGMLGW
jgi:hypothetical protein